MKKVLLSLVAFCVCAIALHVFSQTAPVPPVGAVPQSWLTEVWHVLSIVSGWNALLSAVQVFSASKLTPTKAQVTSAALAVGSAAVDAAKAAATAAATQAAATTLAPALTGGQQVASAALALSKVLSANPTVP